MKQESTDVAQIDVKMLAERPFPGGQRFRVSIARAAHDVVWRQASASVEEARKSCAQAVEVGGVLAGNVWRDGEGPFLDIVAAIPAEHTRNEGTQLTFTPETWAQVNRVKDERYPQTKIVGWYHTHPRFGIFLSDMDKFIHRRSFSQPWTTALVVDPVQQTEGFFVWTDGEPRLTSEYWVGPERRDRSFAGRVAIEAPAEEEAPAAKPPESAVSRATFASVSVLSFLALLFVFSYVYMREVGHTETEKFVLQALEAQKAELRNSYQALTALNQDLENSHKEARNNQAEIEQKIRRVRAGLENVAGVAEALSQRVTAQQQLIERTPLAVPTGLVPAEVKKK